MDHLPWFIIMLMIVLTIILIVVLTINDGLPFFTLMVLMIRNEFIQMLYIVMIIIKHVSSQSLFRIWRSLLLVINHLLLFIVNHDDLVNQHSKLTISLTVISLVQCKFTMINERSAFHKFPQIEWSEWTCASNPMRHSRRHHHQPTYQPSHCPARQHSSWWSCQSENL